MTRSAVVMLAILLFAVCAASARTWYITPDGTGDAPTIQAGIDSATAGDTVLVACGTYHDCTHPVPDGNLACVVMKSGVTLLSEMGQPGCVTIDAQQVGRVVYCDSTGSGAAIEGLTLMGGSAPAGGGMRCLETDLTMTDVVFLDNFAGVQGGGLHLTGSAALTLNDCRFLSNTAGSWGGGASVQGDFAEASFTGCVFTGNEAPAAGGGMYVKWGRIDAEGCEISSNVCGSSGAGAYVGIDARGFFRNCVISDNGICEWGGGISVDDGAYLNVFDCTLYRNSFDGILFWGYCGGWIKNSIIADSPWTSIQIYWDEGIADPYIECSDFHGNGFGDWIGYIAYQYGVHGNFSACPSFCGADEGDFHLCDESPCLPGNHPDGYDCGVIGGLGEGCSCGPTQTEATTWGAIKSMYR